MNTDSGRVPRVSPVLAYPGMFRVLRTDLSFFFIRVPTGGSEFWSRSSVTHITDAPSQTLYTDSVTSRW
jgi:hypothetical protein